jgi:serine protease DegQ
MAPQDVTPELAESLKLTAARGALVAQVTKGGPADKGGMKIGDVIIGVDGRPIQDSVAAMAAIAALKPGTNAKFKVTRNQQDLDLGVTVAKRPAPPKVRRTQ